MTVIRRALVVGGSGFIGRWVVRELCDTGWDVTSSTLMPAAPGGIPPLGGSRELVCDLTAPGAVAALLDAAAPDVLFNLSGYGVARTERDPELAEQINARLPLDLVTHCRPFVKVVHVGSALEYGEVTGVLDEAGPIEATTLYGRTKLAGTGHVTRVASQRGLSAMTARLFTVFGPGERPGRLFPTLMQAAGGGARIPLSDGGQQRDFTFVGDVARALVALADAPFAPGAVVNLASGVLLPVHDFVRAVARLARIDEARLGFGDVPRLTEEMSPAGVSTARLRALLGTALPPPLDAIRAAVDAAARYQWP